VPSRFAIGPFVAVVVDDRAGAAHD
jgi:hypothetical protein